ncbi:unnamed protein product [Darwinula stevensoni]|uniref:Uncharacterized protein n=1 Tax=Darwinula stevensoni TaxID=69355 RepID=A0A7R9FQP9_9CRUS|nr:unnamed protein product [Darwinula stevensoni]CAG0899554.1 unnamed protein product [Darwinula stevensoni]
MHFPRFLILIVTALVTAGYAVATPAGFAVATPAEHSPDEFRPWRHHQNHAQEYWHEDHYQPYYFHKNLRVVKPYFGNQGHHAYRTATHFGGFGRRRR